MSFEYVSVEEAIARPGLRMVVIGGVPSPWGESAKGIFEIKEIPWTATRLVYDDPKLQAWAGELSAPIAIVDDEPPRSGWAEILALAERLAPSPSLVPVDPSARAAMMALSEELLGKGGLCWSRRLQAVHAGLGGEGGFHPKVAGYLAKKYGYHPEAAAADSARVHELLGSLAQRLRDSAGDYVFGETLTAADVHLACSLALFAPLPEAACAMHPSTRTTFEWLDAPTRAALDPVLLEHRDRMYARHLQLPLSL